MSIKVRDTTLEAQAHFALGHVRLESAEGSVTFAARHVGGPAWVLTRDGSSWPVLVARDRRGTWVHAEGRAWLVERGLAREAGGAAADGALLAPMTGKVVEVLVSVGDAVVEGQSLLVLSAMKMRLEIKAPRAGIVRKLPHARDAQVEGGELVVLLELEQPPG